MNKSGPIIIIEDDLDDQDVYKEVFRELNLKNEIIYFGDGIQAFEHLCNSPIEPFIIISDINMPKLTGLELKAQIFNNENLRVKCIPFLFFTTSADQRHVIEAYSKSVQGFFIKPNSFDGLSNTISTIIKYWQECASPDYIK